MNFLEQILYALSGTMEMPSGYGTFHLVSLAVVLLLTAAMCWFFRNASQQTEKRMLMIAWAVLVLMETYRQLLYAVHFDNPVYWDYDWNAFPFQFCSSPLFLFPLAALPKSERVRDVFRMFFATFSLFAGLAVMFYPEGAFSSFIGISIQTMVHHGTMVMFPRFMRVFGRFIKPCTISTCPSLPAYRADFERDLSQRSPPRIFADLYARLYFCVVPGFRRSAAAAPVVVQSPARQTPIIAICIISIDILLNL